MQPWPCSVRKVPLRKEVWVSVWVSGLRDRWLQATPREWRASHVRVLQVVLPSPEGT